jgi:hypothetical protein
MKTSTMALCILFRNILAPIVSSRLIATSTVLSLDLKTTKPFRIYLRGLRTLVRSFALP